MYEIEAEKSEPSFAYPVQLKLRYLIFYFSYSGKNYYTLNSNNVSNTRLNFLWLIKNDKFLCARKCLRSASEAFSRERLQPAGVEFLPDSFPVVSLCPP